MCHGRVLHLIGQVFILGKSLVGLCVGEGFSLAFGGGETLPQSWIFKNFSLIFISLNGRISTPALRLHYHKAGFFLPVGCVIFSKKV